MKKTKVEQVLDFVEANGPMRYIDILRFFVEVVNGDKYDWRIARGRLSFHMCLGHRRWRRGYYMGPAFGSGRCRWLCRISKGLYEVRKY